MIGQNRPIPELILACDNERSTCVVSTTLG
jgi:hypothetical protein